MLKIISRSIIIFIFIGCNSSAKVDNKKQNNEINMTDDYQSDNVKHNGIDSTFINSISKINKLELPLHFYCGAETYTWAEDLGYEILKIVPLDYVVIGLLPINNENAYVIYGKVGDIIYPYLYTYNKIGGLLDSFYLHISYCDGDDSEIHSTVTTIDDDYSIYMSDTSKYIHYNDMNELFLDSIIIKERELKLENNLFKLVKDLSVPLSLDRN
jgi:hypothetical protein